MFGLVRYVGWWAGGVLLLERLEADGGVRGVVWLMLLLVLLLILFGWQFGGVVTVVVTVVVAVVVTKVSCVGVPRIATQLPVTVRPCHVFAQRVLVLVEQNDVGGLMRLRIDSE